MSGILLASVGNSYGSLPVNIVAPAVTGTATVGQTLSTTNGTWTGAPAPTFSYQWQRNGGNIAGATSSTYLLVEADAGNPVRCVVTATNPLGAVSANSNATASVAATVPGAPTIGTATATGSTTATVVFTAPASDGGATITSYTATSTPGSITGTLSQAGSGTITVTGLSGATSYTFTVTATNSAGTSAASAASNSITTVPVIGSAFGGGFFAGQIGVSGVATHNLVVGPTSSGQFIGAWNTTSTTTAGTDSVIDGPANTAAMIAAGAATHPCGNFCNNAVIGGFSDWYMPAKNEMEVCYFNLKPNTNANNTSSGINPNAVPARASNYPGGSPASNPAQTSVAAFQTGGAEAFTTAGNPGDYWNSTQHLTIPTRAYLTRMNFGGQYSDGKAVPVFTVRAVRRVAV
jgi:hypothetical protein